ncbi:hypothetical protein M885DRAFT_485535 [Pelagophyceae sp. CCMP2097]|nr:hypothetical protein M885DRAFT_485535 [Pelagophyceae sp. CCMP2097]
MRACARVLSRGASTRAPLDATAAVLDVNAAVLSESANAPAQRLSESAWRSLASAHRARVSKILGGSPEVIARDKGNPVVNFIFTYYYGFKPRDLSRWSPGPNVSLQVADDGVTGGGGIEDELAKGNWHRLKGDLLLLTPPELKRRETFQHARGTISATSKRAPVWNCYGLHEWAMVYADSAPLRQHLPLRLDNAAIAAVVEAPGALRCTHFDAYRFFTPAAKPLNLHADLSRSNQTKYEQPGCVHAQMDLFKYSIKLGAFLDAKILADALEIAFEARVLDMRASPYDLSEFDGSRGLDLSPLRARGPRQKTSAGRKQYTMLQARLSHRAEPVRRDVLFAYDDILLRTKRET